MQGDLFAGPTCAQRDRKVVSADSKITWDLRQGDWRTSLRDVDEVDVLITDAPYSDRVHKGHNKGVTGAKASKRRQISYSCMSPELVAEFVTSWSPRCKGWFLTITDHLLAPVWAAELARTGRYVFDAPVPFVAPGSRVRLMGDGPSNWSTWLVIAARPRERHKALWGTKRGAYVLPEGTSRDRLIPGSKPIWLMRELILDYSRPGDLICDPFAGAGTTLLAARLEGRNSIGAEVDADTYKVARDRLDQRYTPRLPLPAESLEPKARVREVAP